MQQTEIRELDYINKTFSKLSFEKQENVLKRARSLLAIQKNDVCQTAELMLRINKTPRG